MSLIYTKLDLTNLAAKIQCCAVDYSSKSLKAEKYNFSDKQCYLNKLLYLNRVTCIINSYIPPGTLLEEGYTSSAQLDFTTFTNYGVIIGNVIVNGVTVGSIPEKNYPDMQSLIDAVVLAVNSSSYGYTAVDNADGTVTLNSPGPGYESNGFIVTVEINPTFILEKVIDDLGSGKTYNQLIHINNPSSFFNGYTIIAQTDNFGPGLIGSIVAFKNIPNTSADYTVTFLTPTIRGIALSYDPDNDRLLVMGLGGYYRIGVILPGFIYNSTNDILIPITPPTYTLGSTRAYYNSFNNTTYFVMSTNGSAYQYRSLFKLDQNNAQSFVTVQAGFIAVDLRVNPVNGDVWVMGSLGGGASVKNVQILDTSDTVTTVIAPVNYQPTAIEYYPGDGSVGSERMFIAFQPLAPATDYRIASYFLDGTLDNANFHTSLGPIQNISYSALWNNLFVTQSTNVEMIRLDGTLKQYFNNQVFSASGFVDHSEFNYTVCAGTAFSSPLSKGEFGFFTLTNDGEDLIDGALEGGTPNIYSTDADNCLSEDEIKNVIEVANSLCCNCC